MENIIDVSNVTKIYKLYQKPSDRVKETFSRKKKQYYEEFYALDHVSFSVEKGATLGIVGRNGSGKSTLLKILTGVLKPTEGDASIRGKVSALLELGAGFNMEFTGRENIYLNGTIMRIPRNEMEKKVPEILKFADIGNYIDQPVKTYSSGMFVRLAFAVAITVNPDILIVDEALAVGDTRFQLKCMDKFKEFQEQGKTILFVSHDINSIKRFCKRVIWINQGHLVMDGETDRVTDLYTDFIKSDLPISEFLEKTQDEKQQETVGDNITQEQLDNIDIADLLELKMYNAAGEVVSNIKHGELIRLVITYAVSDVAVQNPVLGVAIRSVDEEYICGINTMLDQKEIPWGRGINTVEVVYREFNLTGGNYYFDVALMDGTATVNLDYKSMMKTFFVEMDYIAEGIVVLSHYWR